MSINIDIGFGRQSSIVLFTSTEESTPLQATNKLLPVTSTGNVIPPIGMIPAEFDLPFLPIDAILTLMEAVFKAHCILHPAECHINHLLRYAFLSSLAHNATFVQKKIVQSVLQHQEIVEAPV